MLWLQRALGAVGGVGRLQGSPPSHFLEFSLSRDLGPLLRSRGTAAGARTLSPSCRQTVSQGERLC